MLNRRAIAAKLSELHSLCQRYGNWYSVILLDIDHFKLLHDNPGHLKGDENPPPRIAECLIRHGCARLHPCLVSPSSLPGHLGTHRRTRRPGVVPRQGEWSELRRRAERIRVGTERLTQRDASGALRLRDLVQERILPT
ncbi:MAG: diguanylate cyclase [Proteobacteria bacterium]|nr:diguanylate cyclase [Pseudomonadota bacterium]